MLETEARCIEQLRSIANHHPRRSVDDDADADADASADASADDTCVATSSVNDDTDDGDINDVDNNVFIGMVSDMIDNYRLI